ncbi:uncharacterized protein EI90DRAFT_3231088 [Cantharellus anzutake]|uniref:uncharacterized protein n=1 Tax=Cantharellus anzutake TaxID=1750568 RepID=UPI001905C491|nr:uncharacterized protein EI90DRAFT_3231088 [Cantharellus anzutake]KAF8325996.1 hypothetical protein EI90DRAFT_3231088 [Cantharellus anzutake]
MSPHLQFMCGPLLRYDTVIDGVWHGAVMIVTADQGSVYSPSPYLSLEWDPSSPLFSNGADTPKSPKTVYYSKQITGEEIWVYYGTAGTFTFWRFMIEIPLSRYEMGVSYQINNGARLEFFVPAIGQNLRWAVHSCNGFSAGINPDDFKGPGFVSGYDPLWVDLLNKHYEKPFHALVGGGDQIYCDKVTQEPEIQDWINKKLVTDKINYQLTDEMRFAIDRFYFSHYCLMFRSGAFARCTRTIPMVSNCLDDHDLIDGFGSYPADLQSSPVFNAIGARGYFFFLLFQQFTVDAVDGSLDMHPHPNRALIMGELGPWIPSCSHSLLTYLGPQAQLLLLDCRAERRKERIVSEKTYKVILDRIRALPTSVEHLVLLLGVPIAYPRMNFLESALESKLNPFIALARSGFGMSGFVNKFNKEAELLDDLNDHWTATHHKAERNWLVQELQKVALSQKLRITFLSGDVHCAAVGLFKSLVKSKKGPGVDPYQDHRYMLNVVTSAIVNTPPPAGVLKMVGLLGKKTHKTLHSAQTDEVMVPLFKQDTDGTPLKANLVMGRRNWCQVDWDESSGDLIFDIRVEKEKGYGTSVSYPIHAPAPRWSNT